MAERTVLDLQSVDYVTSGDIAYIVRGTGAGRDKQVRVEGGLIPSYGYSDVSAAVNLSTYYGDVEFVGKGSAGSITLTLTNILRTGKILNIINASSTYDVILAGSIVAVIKPGHSLRSISDGTSQVFVSYPIVDASGNLTNRMAANITGAISSGATGTNGVINIKKSSDGTIIGVLNTDGADVTLTNKYVDGSLNLQTNSITRIELGCTGHVGIGHAPEDWSNAYVGVDIGGTGAIFAYRNETIDSSIALVQNAYYDGQWKRKVNDETSRYVQASGLHYWYSDAADTADVAFTPTARMTLDPDGDLNLVTGGVFTANASMTAGGTISGGALYADESIHVGSTGYNGIVYFKRSSNGAVHGSLSSDGTDIILANTGGGGKIRLQTGGSDRVQIDTAGNLGIGRAPEAWNPASVGIDIGGTGSIMSYRNETINGAVYYTQNMYFDTTWKRKVNDESCSYLQYAGTHRWFGDSAGTPDVTFSPTERMHLDSIGNLGIGTTPKTTTQLDYVSVDVGASYNITSHKTQASVFISCNEYFYSPSEFRRKVYGGVSRLLMNDGFSWYTAGTDAADSAVSVGVPKMSLSNSGAFTVPGVYAATTSSAANVYVASDGRILRSTSSRRYKENERLLEMDTSKVYDIELKTFNMTDSGQIGHGPIAEDIALVEENFATYDLNGEPEAIHTNHILYALIEEVRKLQERIEFLEGVI